MLEITYNAGRGRLRIADLDQFFPRTAGDMKIVIDIIARADDPEPVLRTVYDHLAARLQPLEGVLKADPDLIDSKTMTLIKRYRANIQALNKKFNLKEEKTMSTATATETRPEITFAADHMTVNGTARPVAGYSVNPSKTVFVFVEEASGRTVLRYDPDHPLHAAALAAAEAAREAVKPADDRREIIPAADPVPAAAPSRRRRKAPAQAADDRHPARDLTRAKHVEIIPDPAPRRSFDHITGLHDGPAAPTPEKITAEKIFRLEASQKKLARRRAAEDVFLHMAEPAAVKPAPADDRREIIPDAEPVPVAAPTEAPRRQLNTPVSEAAPAWINTRIRGRGWVIDFDGAADRTMVTIANDLTAAARKLLQENNFHYAPSTKTYNKKLTWKSYRAALKLADGLRKIYA